MRLPNKVTPYKESVISLFPIILNLLLEEAISPSALFKKCEKKVKSLALFMQAVMCLYALGKIDFDRAREVLTYVD